VGDAAKGYFGESPEWDLSLGRIFYLFPIRRQGNQAQTGPFLEFLDTLLTGRPLRAKLLIPEFLETACVHYFERYGAYVQNSPGQDRQVVDRALTVFLLQSQLLLLYLKELGQLESLSQGGELMEIEREALDEKLQAYFQELNLDRGQQALFLLGYLIGQIGSTREQRGSSKPILNKVHFQGMDQGKVMRLANEVYEKLRQYKIADYNEAVYAAMKALLDREQTALNSSQENTYWLLSGYAYATWQAIRHGKTKQGAPQAGTAEQA
jgi:CRISPR-associated protein Csh1